ncbi:hypothetical protein BRC81_02295 [Halobacteriales archaeon QS_1_68_20]|nr:MAG: hypothetical protein BRC81_02295 [Halobacteriales archaeon QS_1_68_20]
MTSSSTSGEGGRDLRFAVGDGQPTIPDLTVYRRRELDLLGAPAKFAVIGSSHYVAAPELGFYETASCKSLGNVDPAVLSLSEDLARTFGWDAGDVTGRTVIETEPLSAFPRDRAYDLRYDFERRATTAIAVGDGAFETYHTYPELDLTLYTETTLRRR